MFTFLKLDTISERHMIKIKRFDRGFVQMANEVNLAV